MKRSAWTMAVLTIVALLGGCIVSDQLTTLTLNPDGSADLVIYRSNLRSTEKGDRAAKELADYRAKFEARDEDDVKRIREVGGKVLEAAWIRSNPPYANFMSAHFPNASALETFATLRDENGPTVITTEFRSEGLRRRMTVHVAMTGGTFPSAPQDAGQLRQAWADGISEMRIAVANGAIVAARGFTVAGDKQSALVNWDAIAELLKNQQGKAELFLEWEVAP